MREDSVIDGKKIILVIWIIEYSELYESEQPYIH